ncbi:MAG: sigma-70 family RNA polymerase sigma factor [Actinomycetota bacterium]|nr:sigma-70 family RNA polymerase sigma factor [Actinomycetota bacterium]
MRSRTRRREGPDPLLLEIEAIYRERFAAFVRMAIAITGDEQLARDAVHDGFVRAVRYRSGLRGRDSALGWVCRIVLNEARKRHAREGRYVPTDPRALSAGSTLDGESSAGDVRAAVTALPERQRHALFLRYYADLDYSDIAEALEIAPGTVSATLSAARANLRANLKEVEPWTT